MSIKKIDEYLIENYCTLFGCMSMKMNYMQLHTQTHTHVFIQKKNPNTMSDIRTRDPQIVRAVAIPLDHWGLKECLDYDACFSAPTAQEQWNIHMYICHDINYPTFATIILKKIFCSYKTPISHFIKKSLCISLVSITSSSGLKKWQILI